ncbi:uncharacterized protein LOC110932481 [Helianthus annuus]|uniref:uncharacterized protein LOC110932481 n=1 Tax=Helianthus annuus TaxID=4232 RepID=UPI000B8F3B4C|nr:uncharacterized protein LOC110932481 [Helianthus annuus]
MIKWAVRFKNEPDSLWARVIDAIHGGGRCLSYIPLKNSTGGVWKGIINMGRMSQNQLINVKERLTPIIGNGEKTLFWLDNWIGGGPLSTRYPEIFALESNKRCMVSERYVSSQNVTEWKWGSDNALTAEVHLRQWAECTNELDRVTIHCKPDTWLWKSGSRVEDFVVSSVRKELDKIDTIKETKVLRWLHWIPKKVNCFMWRVVLDRIATRDALQVRHIQLPSTNCVLCNNTRESADHLLLTCETTQLVWTTIFQWLKIPLPNYILSVVQLLEIIHSQACSKNKKKAAYAVVAATCWCIWLMRNDVIFKVKPFSMSKLIGDIKATSHSWIKHRAGLSEINWEKWRSFSV